MPTSDEVSTLKRALEEIREPMNHDYENVVRLVDYLCDQLKSGVA